MSEDEMKLEIRIGAMEQVLKMLLAAEIRRQSPSLDQAKALLDRVATNAAIQTVSAASPVESDMIAAEWEDAIRALLDGVLEMAASKP